MCLRKSGVARVFGILLGVWLCAATASAQTSKPIAVLIASFTNYPTPSASVTTARVGIFTGTVSAAAMLREDSYGLFTITGALQQAGDIFGPYAMPITIGTTCAPNTWTAAIRLRAAADGFDNAAYAARVYVLPNIPSCPPRAWTSGQDVFIISGFSPEAVLHELGHAFGLYHATSWFCYQFRPDGSWTPMIVTTSTPLCRENEYGDFATMGGTTRFHFNAFHKATLGWLIPQTITIGQSVTLAPIEIAPSAARVQYVVDSFDHPLYLYMEFRQAVGLDTLLPVGQRGVILHSGSDFTGALRNYKPKLLDGHPDRGGWFGDAALRAGDVVTAGPFSVRLATGVVKTFPALSIRVDDVTPTSATISIN